MTIYFGFGIAPSMFPENCAIVPATLTDPNVIRALIVQAVPCLNPSHKATIAALTSRYGIEVAIPEKAPQVSLGVGDSVLVMSAKGLPRLEGRHEYTEEEIASAQFTFIVYAVMALPLPTVLTYDNGSGYHEWSSSGEASPADSWQGTGNYMPDPILEWKIIP